MGDSSLSYVELLKKSTVLLEVGSGEGSGFFLGNQGHVVTAAHVVDGAYLRGDPVMVRCFGREEPLIASLLAFEAQSDLAILKVEWEPEYSLLVSQEPVKQLDSVIAAGFPFGSLLLQGQSGEGLNLSLNPCTITAVRESEAGVAFLQLDSQMNPGNSGGPVVNQRGELVGVVSSTVIGGGINFIINASMLDKMLSGPTSALCRYDGFSYWNLEHPTSVQFDSFFIRPPSEELTVEMRISPEGGEPRVVPLARGEAGSFLGQIPALYECLPENEGVELRVLFQSGDRKSVVVRNGKILLDSEEYYLQSFRRFDFDTSGAVKAERRSGVTKSASAYSFYESLLALGEGLPRFDLEEVRHHDIVQIQVYRSYTPSKLSMKFVVSDAGKELVDLELKHIILEFWKSTGDTGQWIGPRITPAVEPHLWGPALSARANPAAGSEPYFFDHVDISARVRVRKAPQAESVEAKSDWLDVSVPPGMSEVIPINFGKHALLNFPATRSFGLFDMETGAISHYGQWAGQRCLLAGVGDKLYLYLDNQYLVRLDAATLAYEGAIEFGLPYEVRGMNGTLGKSETLVFHGKSEVGSNYSISVYHVASQEVVNYQYNSSRGPFHCFVLDNGFLKVDDVYFTKENGGYVPVLGRGNNRLGAAIGWSGTFFVRNGGLFSTQWAATPSKQYDVLGRYWSGDIRQAAGNYIGLKNSFGGVSIYRGIEHAHELEMIASVDRTGGFDALKLIHVNDKQVHLLATGKADDRISLKYHTSAETYSPVINSSK